MACPQGQDKLTPKIRFKFNPFAADAVVAKQEAKDSPSCAKPVEEIDFDLATFGGILSLEEADLSESQPAANDQRLFDLSLAKVPVVDLFGTPSPSKSVPTQPHPSSISSLSHRRGRGRPSLKTPIKSSQAPEIRQLYFGLSAILIPWYSSPFPAEYYTTSGVLYMCEWCLKYHRTSATMRRHLIKCRGRLPPGDEIYRSDLGHGVGLSVFEIDGRKNKLYCQNICLLAKMFLDHKTLYYDVDTFLFYVLIEWKQLYRHPKPSSNNHTSPTNTHYLTNHESPNINHQDNSNTTANNDSLFTYSFVGYFSKEKHSPSDYNVSCIVTLPNHQKRGYGAFLIDFSYLLSRREGKRGTPEKPLSDLGLISYTNYWIGRIVEHLRHLQSNHQPVVLESLSSLTGITINDILATLEYLDLLKFDSHTNSFCLDINSPSYIDRLNRWRPLLVMAQDSLLRWVPYNCIR